jgi:hypothetical protein
VHANTARPAANPAPAPVAFPGYRANQVVVLDSGLADMDALGVVQRPPILNTITAFENDLPGDPAVGLNPMAGHGTFITGIIDMLSPGSDLEIHRVFKPAGDVDELTVALRIFFSNPGVNTIFNMSFGGYLPDYPVLLRKAIRWAQLRGAVVVASAGNDGCCRKTYPAAYPDVIAVSALASCGPAPFTNWGSWVRACAPGVDIMSCFYSAFNGPGVPMPGIFASDPDNFASWAIWSGTSFASPAVVAALLREMQRVNCNAKQAVERVIDAPDLARLPYLGTVVNLSMNLD